MCNLPQLGSKEGLRETNPHEWCLQKSSEKHIPFRDEKWSIDFVIHKSDFKTSNDTKSAQRFEHL